MCTSDCLRKKGTNGLFVAKDGTLYGCQGNPGAIIAIDPAAGESIDLPEKLRTWLLSSQAKTGAPEGT